MLHIFDRIGARTPVCVCVRACVWKPAHQNSFQRSTPKLMTSCHRSWYFGRNWEALLRLVCSFECNWLKKTIWVGSRESPHTEGSFVKDGFPLILDSSQNQKKACKTKGASREGFSASSLSAHDLMLAASAACARISASPSPAIAAGTYPSIWLAVAKSLVNSWQAQFALENTLQLLHVIPACCQRSWNENAGWCETVNPWGSAMQCQLWVSIATATWNKKQ